MRPFFQTLLFLTVLLGLFPKCSCKKEPSPETSAQATASGQVLDQISNKPVPYASIQLLWEDDNGLYHGPIDSTKADGNGNFNLKYTYDKRFYALTASAKNYQSSGGSPYALFSKNENITLKIQPYGWVNLFVQYTSMTNDEVDINEYPTAQVRAPHDSTFYIRKIGGRGSIAYFTYKSSKETGHYADSLFIPPLDTVKYTIHY